MSGSTSEIATRFGVHVSVGDGFDETIAYARRVGCTALQIFTSSPRSYRVTEYEPSTLARFREQRERTGVDPCVIHTSYLINFASEDPKVAGNSRRLLANDLEVAASGAIRFVNTHLGSYGTRDRNEGFAAVVAALERVLEKIKPGVELVLENSAGAGQLCGGTVEELGELLRAIGHPQLGVCIDTAHAWAAGYQIDSSDGVQRFFELLERHLGIERVRMFHLNDTQIPLGGHRDRHWHIGQGLIGVDGFRALLAHEGVVGKTAILETPGEEPDDVRNLALIRELAGIAG